MPIFNKANEFYIWCMQMDEEKVDEINYSKKNLEISNNSERQCV